MDGAREIQTPRIWVIDDAVEDRDLAVRAIRHAFPAAAIETPVDAASLDRLLRGERPDAVVTDYRLRWTDGLQVLARVKAKDASIPVIMFTNTGSEEVCAEGMKAGLSDYIIKRRDQYPKVSHSVRMVLEHAAIQRKLADQEADLTRSRSELAHLLHRERRARAEAEAARAEAVKAAMLKDQFLATLSHELRTPLNAVLGWAHLLQMKKGDDKAFEQGIQVIVRNTRLQAQLVSDLLDMSRIASGQMRLELEVLDLAAAVAAVVQSVKPNADQKSVELSTTVPPEPLMVRADPARLEQIIWNLIVNAIKFTGAGGRVEVSVRKQAGRACLEVSDNGEGIAPEFLPHVFEMFRQADGSRTRTHGGLGIGLAIVKELTEMHRGEVRAESAGPGHGSRFAVMLPLVDAEPAMPRRSATAPGTASLAAPDALKGLLILSVDDDPDTCHIVSRLLSDHGADVRCASSAAEGFEMLRTLRPDVLISDVGMPGEDGYSFIARVRTLPPEDGGRVPAVALTAFARSEDRQRGMAAGFDAFSTKPIEPDEFIALIVRLVTHAK